MVRISAIVAVAANGVIGKDNDIPWRGRIPGEQKLFKEYTQGKAVVMGRRTWESLPPKYRPLPGRTNIVVSSDNSLDEEVVRVSSLPEALMLASTLKNCPEIVLIGGQRIYEEGLKYCDTLYISRLDAIFPGDAFFPDISDHIWEPISEERFEMEAGRSVSYSFRVYNRKPDPVTGSRSPVTMG